MSHIEKDKHDFEPSIDTVANVPDRIIDTIPILMDSVPADTVPPFIMDTIMLPDTVQIPTDTLTPHDSLRHDTLTHEKPIPLRPQRSASAIETQVICSAADSVYRDVKQKKIYFFGNAEAKYDDITIQAACLEFDLETNTCRAFGTIDSLGKLQGRPVFTQGETTFDAAEMSYNFKSKKGVITKVWTEESGGYLHGEKIKRMDDNSINIRSGGYTTCDLRDHPHYQFRFTKAKVIPDDKIVTGPIYMTISDIPLPLALPFAMIPNTKGKKSGIVIPTYGESANRGFYLENGGYYWAINDNYDLQVLGDIYTRGSWGIKPTFRYNKRYRFNGNIALGFAVNKIGTKGAADYKESTDFKIRWSHKQDPKAHPRHSFSADVNIVSSNFNKYNATTTSDQLSNTFKSSVAYQTSFAGKYFLTLNASHSQNTLTRQVTASLPEVTFTVNRFYPLKKVGKVGKKHWYQEMNVSYTMNGKVYINDVDTVLFKGFTENFGQWAQNVLRNHAQMGIKHNIPINLPIKLFKHFTWTNSATFNDYMYFKHIENHWIADTDSTGHLQTDTIHGFRNLVDFNLSSNLTTKLYGMVRFAKGPIRAIRHVITPTVGFTYKPNFGDPKWNIYNSYVDGNGKEQIYNMFANGIFGSPSQNQSGLITYNIANTLDMKVPSRSDTITGMKKITLLEALSISGNYDVTRDSLNFSTLGISARTTLFKKLRISYNSVWDPYAADSLGNRINKFEIVENGRLFHKNNSTWQFSMSYSFSQKDFDKLKKKRSNTPQNFQDDIANRAQRSMNITDDELYDIMGNPNAYVDWNTPWSLSLSYNLSYTNSLTYAAFMGIATNRITNTISINGDISITPKWKVTFTTGWDITNKGLSNTQFSVYRDLHCWEMRFNWIPIGNYKSWNFSINVKAQALKDLKLTKKKDYRDN
ncbi:MAG: LPS-assembly protein LptD [Bacteroidales bacterium]|nr:LPS-assembly protein LptD [Bacteroidales bacterium]MBQ6305645.1 LPS-assembly protein LptD [Bacteroidales bacterium]